MTARVRLAWCHAELGMFAEARALGEAGLRIAEAANHPASLMSASREVGLLCLRQGDLPRAIPLLERAIRICQDVSLPIFLLQIGLGLGTAYMLGGRLHDGRPRLMQALVQVSAMDPVGLRARDGCALGEALMLAGHLQEARASAEGALARARAQQERSNQAYALHLLGEIAARREPPERVQAEAHYSQALTLAEELDMGPLVAHCHHGLGTLYVTTGQREQARTELSTAIDLYRAMEMTFWLPQAEAALAQVERP